MYKTGAFNSKNCKIHKRVRGLEKPSDHAPVMVEINWPPIETDDEEDAVEEQEITT